MNSTIRRTAAVVDLTLVAVLFGLDTAEARPPRCRSLLTT